MGRWIAIAVLAVGCRQILGIEDLQGGGGGDGGGDGGPVDAPIADGGGPDANVTPPDAPMFDASAPRDACSDVECRNCLDDDVDGRTDWDDPECTSPEDDDEDSFGTNIPADNSDPCVADCWFDGNSGAGDDNCHLRRTCDSQAAPSLVYAACPSCLGDPIDTPPACVAACLPKQPNGCDCFGCCTVFVDGDPIDVVLHSACEYGLELGDPDQCPLCLKNPNCDNPCEPCEYCLGRDPVGSCTIDAGGCGTPCNPHEPDACGTGAWCLTGCCVPI